MATKTTKKQTRQKLSRQHWLPRPLAKLKATIILLVSRFRLGVIALLMLILGTGLLYSLMQPGNNNSVPTPTQEPRQVETIIYGESELSEHTVGVVKNLSSITLVAQSAGPINKISVTEGQSVKSGQLILSQSTAYASGNAATVQRQVAAKNAELAEKTLSSTAQTVSLTRQQADAARDNTEELRKIADQSINETKSLITTTEQVIAKIEADILSEQTTTNDADTIQGLRQQLITYQGVLNQNRSALRGLEYQVDTDQPGERLANLAKDVVYASTQLQLESAQLSRDIALLNLQAAKISEAMTRVQAPFAGRLEKLYVQPGQYVTPGTPVAVITGEPKLCVQVSIAGALVGLIDQDQGIEVNLPHQQLLLPISHLSATAVNGQLYELLATLPAQYLDSIFENQTISVKLPLIGHSDQGTHFLPIDAVFVTNTGKYVLVVGPNNIAAQRSVSTGDIVGSSIEITDGLMIGDQVILNRQTIPGEQVTVTPPAAEGELG